MRRRARFAVLAAVSLGLAASSVTPTRALSGECYELLSLQIGEERSLTIEVENKPKGFFDRRDPWVDRGDEDNWRFGHGWDVQLVVKRSQGDSEEEAGVAADAEVADPLPQLVVTTHDGEEDPSAPILSFQLDRPAGSRDNVLDKLRIDHRTAPPSC